MASLYESRREQMFPKLTPAQLTRIEAYGEKVRIRAPDLLIESGERYDRIVVVLSGSIEVVRPGLSGEGLITALSRGDFTGEMSALRGSASLVRIRVLEDGEAIAISHESLRRLVQTDSELSELFMRAFILRRMGLIASQQGDVVLVGSRDSAPTLRVEQFLDRNGLPHVCLDVNRDPDVAALLERFHVGIDDVPVVICRGEQVLKNPGNEEIAACLRMNPQIDDEVVRDLVVIGAGSAGLAAAVYAASEGLSVLVLETLGTRRSGGLQLENRELSRLSDRHFRRGARRARARAGPEVRRGRTGRRHCDTPA
jgi:thioredoxin reductase (NADPH)